MSAPVSSEEGRPEPSRAKPVRSAPWRRPVLLSLVLLGLLSAGAAADCPGPGLTVEPATAAAGTEVEVMGEGLYDGICYDVGGCLQQQPDKARPAEGLALVLVAADGTHRLGGFDPGEDWRRTETIRLPRAAQPGRATMQVLREDGTVFASAELVLEPAS